MKANIFTNKTKLARGFTLIELLVVVSIIGMLASVVLVSLQGARNKARDIKLIAEVKQLQNALELYRLDNGAYPGVGTIYATNGVGCPGATQLLTTVFDQNFRTKYMPMLPTELVSCGIYYSAFSGTADLTSLSCSVPPGDSNSTIHPDGFNGANNPFSLPNQQGNPLEAYSYVFLIKTLANPSNVTYPVLTGWQAYNPDTNIRCILGPKR